MKTPTWLNNIISPPIKLTEREAKVESVIKLLLSKPETSIKTDWKSNSFLLSNKVLNFHAEVNGSISLCGEEGVSISEQFRLVYVEHIKDLVTAEESERYRKDKEIIFKKSLSLLDKMETKLRE